MKRVLVVAKQTALELLHEDPSPGARRMLDLVERDHPSVSGIQPAHDEHMQSLAQVRAILERRNIEFYLRTWIPRKPIRGMDAVLTVGGDGMVLGVSHVVRDDTPVLGVNSAPSFSVGYLTGTASANLDDTLDRLESGDLTPRIVHRLKARLGRRVLGGPVLNDVLFCTDNPAVMCRYRLRWPDGVELQRSSGVWVSTPAGSTSALASAGGPILPLAAKQFAFQVREPYAPPGAAVRYKSAVLQNDELTIENRSQMASVFLDGSHRRYSVPFGETLTISLHERALRLIRP